MAPSTVARMQTSVPPSGEDQRRDALLCEFLMQPAISSRGLRVFQKMLSGRDEVSKFGIDVGRFAADMFALYHPPLFGVSLLCLTAARAYTCETKR